MSKLIKGEDSINEIASEIIRAGYDSAFLITGKHFQKQNDPGFLQSLHIDQFIKSGTNVELEEGEKAFEQYSRGGRQAIIAIGGGSVIDLAKYIIYQLAKTSLPIPFFVAAPTTAGSGSEATHFAVVYKEKLKTSLAHPYLLPSLVILDPKLCYSLTPYLAAVSGMDAISQAVESYWNRDATVESKQWAAESINLWKKHFINSVVSAEKEAREGLLESAYLAGKAINITRTTGPHALSYFLTANYDIPHGQAVAIFLPLFFLFNKPQDEIYRLLEVTDEQGAANFIKQKMREAGLACSLSELGINKENIVEPLLNDVNQERFENNPVKFDREKLKQLILDYL